MAGIRRRFWNRVDCSILALMLSAGVATADAAFSPPAGDFKGQIRFSADKPVAPVLPGSEVVARGRGFVPGQTVILQSGPDVLTATPAVANDKGEVELDFKLPEGATVGTHPIVVIAEKPSATVLADLKISPEVPLSGADRFDIASEPVTGGLYQVAYGNASKALFVTATAGRPPKMTSELLKIDPATMEILARVTPAEAPGSEGRPGGVFAVYGVGTDDAHGTVWVTNTRQNTVAVYAQDDLSLVKQFAPDTVQHSRDVVIDAGRHLAFASAARASEIPVFDTETLEQLTPIAISSEIRGESFGTLGIALDAAAGKLFAVSMTTPEAAVIDIDSRSVEKVVKLPGAITASSIAYDSETGRLFVASQGSDDLLVLDMATGAVVADVPVGAGALNVVFDPVQRLAFVSVRAAGTIAVVDPDGKLVANLDGGTFPNQAIADGKGGVWAVNKSFGDNDPNGNRLWHITAK